MNVFYVIFYFILIHTSIDNLLLVPSQILCIVIFMNGIQCPCGLYKTKTGLRPREVQSYLKFWTEQWCFFIFSVKHFFDQKTTWSNIIITGVSVHFPVAKFLFVLRIFENNDYQILKFIQNMKMNTRYIDCVFFCCNFGLPIYSN